MHNDDTPEANAHELLLFTEQRLLSGRIDLGSRIVVEAKLDGKADETTDKTPQCYSLTLMEDSEWLSYVLLDTHLCVQIPVKKDQSLQA